MEAGRQTGKALAPFPRGGQHRSSGLVWTPRRLGVGRREPTEDANPLMQLGSAEMLRVEQEPPRPQRPPWPQGIIATAWRTAEQDPTPGTSHGRDLAPRDSPGPSWATAAVTAHLWVPSVCPWAPHVRRNKHKGMNEPKRNCTELQHGAKEVSKDPQTAWPRGRAVVLQRAKSTVGRAAGALGLRLPYLAQFNKSPLLVIVGHSPRRHPTSL